MDLEAVVITANGAQTPRPPIGEPWRGRVVYHYDPKTDTLITKAYGKDGHLGATEDS